jgi:hypothetical protein
VFDRIPDLEQEPGTIFRCHATKTRDTGARDPGCRPALL